MTQVDTIPLGHRVVGMIHWIRASDKNCRSTSFFNLYKLILVIGPIWAMKSQPETRLDSRGEQINLLALAPIYRR